MIILLQLATICVLPVVRKSMKFARKLTSKNKTKIFQLKAKNRPLVCLVCLRGRCKKTSFLRYIKLDTIYNCKQL